MGFLVGNREGLSFGDGVNLRVEKIEGSFVADCVDLLILVGNRGISLVNF